MKRATVAHRRWVPLMACHAFLSVIAPSMSRGQCSVSILGSWSSTDCLGCSPNQIYVRLDHSVRWADRVYENYGYAATGEWRYYYPNCAGCDAYPETRIQCWPIVNPPETGDGYFQQITYNSTVVLLYHQCRLECPMIPWAGSCKQGPMQAHRYTHTCTCNPPCTECQTCSESTWTCQATCPEPPVCAGDPPFCDNCPAVCTSSGWTCGCNESPIIFDMEGDGISLTPAEEGVRFDLNHDGVREKIAWTARGGDDAWLVVDRNGNGRIDDGGEMFGNHSPQPPSPTPNGFLALAEYDKPANGGNADGKIDSRDRVYGSLRLWQDADHNGVSDPAELKTLPSAGVAEIDLNYREARWRDEYGNEFRYRSRVKSGRDSDVGRWAYDVFLVLGR